MAQNTDRPDHNDVIGLLHEIRGEQTRQGNKLDDISQRVTGGLDVAKGLEFRTSQLEAHRDEQRKKDERRETVLSGLIVTVGATLIMATLALIFRFAPNISAGS